MSLSDNSETVLARCLKSTLPVAFVFGVALVSACTVRPLYSNAPLSPGGQMGATAELASIAVKPVNTRYAQQVRNNLIFGLTQGAGEPASSLYLLDLNVTEAVESAASIQASSTQDVPTAGSVVLTANYTLSDAKSGKKISTGKRSMSASFDRPQQEFANYRAQIDAENRAARELAQLLQLALSQDLAKR